MNYQDQTFSDYQYLCFLCLIKNSCSGSDVAFFLLLQSPLCDLTDWLHVTINGLSTLNNVDQQSKYLLKLSNKSSGVEVR